MAVVPGILTQLVAVVAVAESLWVGLEPKQVHLVQLVQVALLQLLVLLQVVWEEQRYSAV